LGIEKATPETVRALLNTVESELRAISDGERGERLEHDNTSAGAAYRAALRRGG
jgi:hypothetical protein